MPKNITAKRNTLEHKIKVQKRDNDNLLQLQQDYLLLRDFRIHSNSPTEKDFINSMLAVARRYIYIERIKNGFYLSAEDVEFKAWGAIGYIMTQFSKRPDFKLKVPTQYIRLRVLSELYRHKKIEEKITYTDREL